MPIQTFNTFPKAVPDAVLRTGGLPEGYSTITPFTTTTTSAGTVTALQLTGVSGFVSQIALATPAGGSAARITYDGTVSPTISTPASSAIFYIHCTNHMIATTAAQAVPSQTFFFSNDIKFEFQSNIGGQLTTIYILYHLAVPGSKKYRTFVVSGNPSVGNNLLSVSGSGFLHAGYNTAFDNYTLILDAVTQSVNMPSGSFSPVLSGATTSPTNFSDMIPFTSNLRLTRAAGSTSTTVMYSLEV